jgi:hypothetical protein
MPGPLGGMQEPIHIAEFTSDKFVPVLPDESQVNPGVFGAELAFWLCTQLAANGVVTSYPQSEDWGWYLDYSTESGAEFAIHCGNVADDEHRWLLSIRAFGRKLFGRDKPPVSEASRLINAIRVILTAEPSVSNLVWRFPGEHAA